MAIKKFDDDEQTSESQQVMCNSWCHCIKREKEEKEEEDAFLVLDRAKDESLESHHTSEIVITG